MLQFRAHVENNKGVVAIQLAATSKSQAGVMIMKSEGCPIEAIKKINLIISKMTISECEFYYLDFFNNWQNVQSFADHYGITVREANLLIQKGSK